jgi:hypothetical protein
MAKRNIDDLPYKSWIGVVSAIARKTVIVKARTRKEAQQLLMTYDGTVEGIDVDYTPYGPGRILRQDGIR